MKSPDSEEWIWQECSCEVPDLVFGREYVDLLRMRVRVREPERLPVQRSPRALAGGPCGSISRDAGTEAGGASGV